MKNTLEYTNSFSVDYFGEFRPSLFNGSSESLKIEYSSCYSELLYYDVTAHSKDYTVPLSAIRNHSSLQAIVVYLKDNYSLTFSEIARQLNRDPRTIWTTYNKAKKHENQVLDGSSIVNDYLIPLDVLNLRNMSVLESIVFYLRTKYELTFLDLSMLLGKNYRTIWTVYRRAIKKLNLENEFGKLNLKNE